MPNRRHWWDKYFATKAHTILHTSYRDVWRHSTWCMTSFHVVCDITWVVMWYIHMGFQVQIPSTRKGTCSSVHASCRGNYVSWHMQKHCTSDRQVSKSVSIQFVTCLKYSVTRNMNEYKDCAWQYRHADSIVALMEVSQGQKSSNSHCPTTIPQIMVPVQVTNQERRRPYSRI